MALERRIGQGSGLGHPKGLTLYRCGIIGNPNRPKVLLALVSSCRLGYGLCATSSQVLSDTKYQRLNLSGFSAFLPVASLRSSNWAKGQKFLAVTQHQEFCMKIDPKSARK